MKDSSHIAFVEQYGETFSKEIGIDIPFAELLKEHLSKVYQHAFKWKKGHVPFHHAVLIYLACHHEPFLRKFTRNTFLGVGAHEWAVMPIYQATPIRGLMSVKDMLQGESFKG